MTQLLQLRLHALKCVTETQNRQNLFGIPLETDPDSIDLRALIVDGGEGVVALPPTVFLGNRYRSGHQETFSQPKVVAEVPIRETDVFPRRVRITLNMAEKDDGAGFDELLERVADVLADEVSDAVGGDLPTEITSSAIYDGVNDVAGDILASILKEIAGALGLGDDPFRPVDVLTEIRSYGASVAGGIQEAIFREPNTAHKGEFRLRYDWHLVDRPATGAARSTARGGARDGSSSAGSVSYPLGYQLRRFRAACRTSSARAPERKVTIVRGRKMPMYAAPLRMLGAPASGKV